MSKTWYPVIDYEKCTECGICFDHCKHGVYSKRESRIIVVEGENCVHGCRGCQSKCPSGAISYVGDDGTTKGGCCCSCC